MPRIFKAISAQPLAAHPANPAPASIPSDTPSDIEAAQSDTDNDAELKPGDSVRWENAGPRYTQHPVFRIEKIEGINAYLVNYPHPVLVSELRKNTQK